MSTKGSGRTKVTMLSSVFSIQIELFRINRLTYHENFHIANSAFYFYIYYKSICTFRENKLCYLKHLYVFLSCNCWYKMRKWNIVLTGIIVAIKRTKNHIIAVLKVWHSSNQFTQTPANKYMLPLKSKISTCHLKYKEGDAAI